MIEILRLESSSTDVISIIFLSSSRLDKLYLMVHCVSGFFKKRVIFLFLNYVFLYYSDHSVSMTIIGEQS